MTAPVKQHILDHLDSERDQVADPTLVTADVDWVTAFEFAGGIQ